MKLHTAVLILTFLGLFSITVNNCVFYVSELEDKAITELQNFTAKRFIAESFRNTCRNQGFSNLDEWQTVCGLLFKLESIDWKLVELDDDNKLFYGSWTGLNEFEPCSAEVYCWCQKEEQCGIN